jgi:hypothetical protein
VRVEEFEVSGIPEGYQVFDVDLTPSGEPVATILNPSASAPKAYALCRGQLIPISDEIFWVYAKKPTLFAKVRCMGEDRFVVARVRAREEADTNAYVYTAGGKLECAFHAGDDIEELLADEEIILAFYGDEGQTNSVSRLSYEAMSAFAADGQFVWGHRSHFPRGERLDVWFHAACWSGANEVALFADVDVHPLISGADSCRFFRIDIARRAQVILQQPPAIELPRAVTAPSQDRLLVHGSAGPNVSREDVIEWKTAAGEVNLLAQFVGRLRGLSGGRFIATMPTGYKIISFD